jgi:hypothetical protein
LVEETVVHEVGHVFGLGHNIAGSSGYPIDSLRNLRFVRRMGSQPSVMSALWENDVAQAEDGFTFRDRLRTTPGAYDRWAIAWGYRPISGAVTPEAELPILAQWRASQDTAPSLQAADEIFALSGLSSTLYLGDDPVRYAEYRVRNLARVASELSPKLGASVNIALANRWNSVVGAVENVLGDMVIARPYPVDRADVRGALVDSALQVRALHFLLAHTFYGEDMFIARQVLGEEASRHSAALVLFDTVAAGWDARQWQGYQRARLNSVINTLGAREWSAQPGVHAALCQELRGLQGRLIARATPNSGTEYARTLDHTLAAALTSSRVCGHH